MANRKPPTETSRYKFNPGDVKTDRSLREDRGWLKRDVRWVVTGQSAGPEVTVIGRTTLPPGVGAMRAIHRDPNAEEWECVIHGTGIKHVGEESFLCAAGRRRLHPEERRTPPTTSRC